jgi:flagellar biosynthetic protein FliR
LLPYLGTPILNLFNQGIEAGRAIPRAAAQRNGQPGSVPAAARPPVVVVN